MQTSLVKDALRDWQMRSSISKKGNCRVDLGFCHNAPTGSFWVRLKTASLYGRKFATRREAMDVVQGTITDVCTRRWGVSARCNTSNTGKRHSVKKPRNPGAKNYTTQGQGQRSDLRISYIANDRAEILALIML